MIVKRVQLFITRIPEHPCVFLLLSIYTLAIFCMGGCILVWVHRGLYGRRGGAVWVSYMLNKLQQLGIPRSLGRPEEVGGGWGRGIDNRRGWGPRNV